MYWKGTAILLCDKAVSPLRGGGGGSEQRGGGGGRGGRTHFHLLLQVLLDLLMEGAGRLGHRDTHRHRIGHLRDRPPAR